MGLYANFSDRGIGLHSQNFYQNQRVLRRSIYNEPVFTSREECKVFADLFLEFIYVFREILSTSMFFCCSISIEIAQNSHEECNEFEDLCFEDYHYAFQETLCPVTLAHIRSLYFIQVYTFIPLINSAPFLCFSHILLYTNFFLCTLPRKILFLSLMTLLPRI